MTNDEIDKLDGRELDAAVAEHVMGHTWDPARCRVCGWPLKNYVYEGCVPGNCSMRPLPERRADEPAHYHTDIAAAWTVVEAVKLKFFEGSCSIAVTRTAAGNPDYRYWCDIAERIYGKDGYASDEWRYHADAATPELAICRAALKATLAKGIP